eukprot:2597883-Lingulodinium_polyedra.AAC.1
MKFLGNGISTLGIAIFEPQCPGLRCGTVFLCIRAAEVVLRRSLSQWISDGPGFGRRTNFGCRNLQC